MYTALRWPVQYYHSRHHPDCPLLMFTFVVVIVLSQYTDWSGTSIPQYSMYLPLRNTVLFSGRTGATHLCKYRNQGGFITHQKRDKLKGQLSQTFAMEVRWRHKLASSKARNCGGNKGEVEIKFIMMIYIIHRPTLHDHELINLASKQEEHTTHNLLLNIFWYLWILYICTEQCWVRVLSKVGVAY